MITALLDTNFDQWQAAPRELGAGIGIGQLLSPLTRFRSYGGKFGVDNGCFKRFDAGPYFSLLKRERERDDQSASL